MEVSDLNFRKNIKLLICSVSDFCGQEKVSGFPSSHSKLAFEQNVHVGKLTLRVVSTHDMYLQALGCLVVEPSHLEKYHIVKLDHFPK